MYVVETSIVLDHYPRIEDDRKDKTNIGNIVSISNLIIHRIIKQRLTVVSCRAKKVERMTMTVSLIELFSQLANSNRPLMQWLTTTYKLLKSTFLKITACYK